MPDGTSRFNIGKDPIFHYMGTSTFAKEIIPLSPADETAA